MVTATAESTTGGTRSHGKSKPIGKKRPINRYIRLISPRPPQTESAYGAEDLQNQTLEMYRLFSIASCIPTYPCRQKDRIQYFFAATRDVANQIMVM